MNGVTQPSIVADYYSGPVCTEEISDQAYGSFVGQGWEAGTVFDHWRDAEAWSVAMDSRDPEVLR